MNTTNSMASENAFIVEAEQAIDPTLLEQFCNLVINWNGRGTSSNIKFQRIREAWRLAQRDSE
ncbi:hypothetical protein GCM10028805_65810 [Spirosoma harenae]